MRDDSKYSLYGRGGGGGWCKSTTFQYIKFIVYRVELPKSCPYRQGLVN